MILLSFALIPLTASIVFGDLAGAFSYSDLPFVIAFVLYGIFHISQKIRSKTTFAISLFFLIWMGFSYIPTGAGVVTERIGEWLFLFFVYGLVQIHLELHKHTPSISRRDKIQPDWDEYYFSKVQTRQLEDLIRHSANHALWYSTWLGYINARVPLYDTRLRVFEIGSGLGGVITLMQQHNVPVTGSDVSPGIVSLSKRIRPDIPYILCNVETGIPLKHPYDRIFAFEVLEHLTKLDNAVTNIYDALKQGGYFVGTTPYPYRHFVDLPTHFNVHGPDFWRQLFRSSGFTSVVTYPMSLPPFLWRIHPKLNFVFPVYVPFKGWISTTLIIAKK